MLKPTVKKCWLEDIAELCLCAKEFNEESSWGLTYDESVAVTQLCAFMMQEERSAIYAVYMDGEIAGGAIVVASQDLSLETLGFIHKLYIRPKYRKTLAPLYLTKALTEWFDDKGCAISFVTDTGGIGGVICAFKKLMGKYGYQTGGPTLHRIKHG
jgi:hypothetical protein